MTELPAYIGLGVALGLFSAFTYAPMIALLLEKLSLIESLSSIVAGATLAVLVLVLGFRGSGDTR